MRSARMLWGVAVAAAVVTAGWGATSALVSEVSADARVGEANLGAAPPLAASQGEIRVGDPAPDFTLRDQERQPVELSQFRGQTVQLAFYVWAFSPG